MRTYRLWLLSLDMVLVLVALTLGVLAAFHGEPVPPLRTMGLDPPVHPSYALALVTILVVWLLWIALGGGYAERAMGIGADELKAVVVGSFSAAGTIAVLSYLTRSDLSRTFLLTSFAVGLPLLLLGRGISRKVLHRLRRGGALTIRVLVVGRPHEVDEVVTSLRGQPWTGFVPVAACLLEGEGRTLQVEGLPLVGDCGEVGTLAERRDIDLVLLAGSPGDAHDFNEIAWQLDRTGVRLAVLPSLAEVAMPRVHLAPVAGLSLVTIDMPAFTGPQRVAKRVFDLVVSAILLPLVLPIWITAAVTIKLTSPGPVLFKQTRVGKGGERFVCLKFRTMVENAPDLLAELEELNEGNGVLFKLKDDPRITRVGHLLRRFSIDELPQLINVLRGEMSLVGPRPPLPEEVLRFSPAMRRRLNVLPGMTGLWQVSGRSDLSAEQSEHLDLHYVDNWSLVSDAQIIWKTVGAVFRRRGAY